MFTSVLRFEKLHSRATVSRNQYKFTITRTLQQRYKNLSIYLKKKSGRNCLGRSIFRPRCHVSRKHRTIKINYNGRYRCFGFTAGLHFIPFKHKLVALIYYVNGSITYYTAIVGQSLFAYLNVNKVRKLNKLIANAHALIICRVKRLTRLCYLELTPSQGAQYIRSSGAVGRLFHINNAYRTAIIDLPSGKTKIVSIYSNVFIGQIAVLEHKIYRNTKAGY
jgi:ribosomal protein L2